MSRFKILFISLFLFSTAAFAFAPALVLLPAAFSAVATRAAVALTGLTVGATIGNYLGIDSSFLSFPSSTDTSNGPVTSTSYIDPQKLSTEILDKKIQSLGGSVANTPILDSSGFDITPFLPGLYSYLVGAGINSSTITIHTITNTNTNTRTVTDVVLRPQPFTAPGTVLETVELLSSANGVFFSSNSTSQSGITKFCSTMLPGSVYNGFQSFLFGVKGTSCNLSGVAHQFVYLPDPVVLSSNSSASSDVSQLLNSIPSSAQDSILNASLDAGSSVYVDSTSALATASPVPQSYSSGSYVAPASSTTSVVGTSSSTGTVTDSSGAVSTTQTSVNIDFGTYTPSSTGLPTYADFITRLDSFISSNRLTEYISLLSVSLPGAGLPVFTIPLGSLMSPWVIDLNIPVSKTFFDTLVIILWFGVVISFVRIVFRV